MADRLDDRLAAPEDGPESRDPWSETVSAPDSVI